MDKEEKLMRELRLLSIENDQLKRMIKFLEDQIAASAYRQINPPVILDGDAHAAFERGKIAGRTDFKHVAFGFYRRKEVGDV